MLPLLLSKRKAAALLGISRGDTLGEMIRAGLIRTVVLNGRVRIPREEVERIAREGTSAPLPLARPRRAPARGPDTEADAIRDLPF